MRSFVMVSGALLLVVGCSSSATAVRRPEAPANVTFPIAFGNYQRVYNTTYHVVNRYAVVKKASYRYGEIEAELGQDNAFFDKTRRTILARIFDAGEYWDVECRVLLQVEDSDVESLNEHQPRYNWRTIASDSLLETKLNNEIKAALSGGAWDAKTPLVPDKQHAAPPAGSSPAPKVVPAPPADDEEGTSEKKKSNLRDAHAIIPQTAGMPQSPTGELTADECERLGLKLFERANYARSVAAFRAAREARPNSPFAAYLLAQGLFASGEYGEAAQAIREGASRNPEWPRAKIDMTSFYGDARELKTQIAKLEAHVVAHEGDVDAQLVLGYIAYFTRDYRRAEQIFSKLERDRPSDGLAGSYRRLALVELDRARGLEEF